MKLSEVMKLTGLSRKAIYLYEEKELLSPNKVPKGEVREYREYTEEDVSRLRLIARLRELEFSLADIEKILYGNSVDMVFHNHVRQQRDKLSELMLTVDKLDETLSKLPPNSSSRDLGCVLEEVLPSEVSNSLSYRLEEDCSSVQVRRVAMLLFEAFLDKPLSTREDWDTWYTILELLEESITPEILDYYAEFYGELTTDQLCEDYALRRRLVCGYTNYSDMEEKAKAAELMQELKCLVTDEDLFGQWYDFYCKLALNNTWHGDVSSYVHTLSNVYSSYEEHFIHMKQQYLDPLLDTSEGKFLKAMITEKMAGRDMFNFVGLIYFDFYNNTLRRVRYGK